MHVCADDANTGRFNHHSHKQKGRACLPAGFSTSAPLPLSRPIAVTDQESTHQAYACMQATPTQGEYSTIAGIDNSGKGLPAGFSNKPLSASQLAAIQATSVQRTHSEAATVATPNAGTSDGGSQQVLSLSCIHQSTLQPCKLQTGSAPAVMFSSTTPAHVCMLGF